MWDFKIKLAPWIDRGTEWLITNFAIFFDSIAAVLLGIHGPIEAVLQACPPWAFIPLVFGIGFAVDGWRLGALCAGCLAFIYSVDLWTSGISTLSAVFTATFFSITIGIPLGILMAEYETVRAVVRPVLDFMQTMPAFVLLVPAVYFFGVGTVGGIVATIIFSMPLPVRLTAHGLSMVDRETVEAGEAFGCTRLQLLALVKLPLAFRTVMAGINQCIMLSLSMVITASFIGAGGLGDEIIRAISRLQIGRGIEAGLAVVSLAIFLDRLSNRFGARVDPTSEVERQRKKKSVGDRLTSTDKEGSGRVVNGTATRA